MKSYWKGKAMAKYTYTLREVISTFGEEQVKNWFMDYELTDFLTPEEITVINERGVWSKEQLANRIIKHYINREVGSEGIGKFMNDIKDMMSELMESYAPLIYSASIKYDPLVNVDFTEEFERTSDSQSQTNSLTKTSGNGLTINSDTPQGQINKNEILAGNYASSTTGNETQNQSQDTATNSGSGNEQYTKRTRGNSGVSATAQRMIQLYRDNIRAINSEIVYALEPLFMSIY